MSKVLITGGAGFIGAHLAREWAAAGAEVHLLDNYARGVKDADLEGLLRLPRVKMLQADMSASGAPCGDYDYIYHLAAIIGVSNVQERPFEVLQANVGLTLKAIEWARGQKCLKRLLFASTSEVYAGTLKHFSMDVPTPEATALAVTELSQPRTTYMLSKIYGEALVIHSGLPYTIFRPHNIYGPRMGMSHVIPELLQKAHRLPEGAPLRVFSVSHTRTFCYVSDAVVMLRLMAGADECRNMTLNLGRQAPEVTIGELAEIILATVGRGAEVEDGGETPGSPARRCPCMEKTISLIGETPGTALRDGINKTYEWYRQTFI